MKHYKATYWRGNPQLKNGGYETTRYFEALDMDKAKRKAEALTKCTYGTMTLIKVEEV